ncbi:MAG: AAA family ATPase [Candidatus Lokiarchaeota archaeon]|nr:AAA family ATPase [Candidatus Lokiarchaeota archaeon]MBD3201355.1 AAA family ATPase [Candidatus Lokiarchaeota archaeon]
MELNDILLNLKIVMFGGKGGVGKTSCASSSAIWAAEHGRKTLIISTDPAHSLGDSLGMKLDPGKPTQVKDVENLYALEINSKADLSDFEGLGNMNLLRGTGMPGMEELPMIGDLGELASMSPPGIDEALAFAKVLEFIETEHDYDLIIFDTAPTGHTLRFLSLPETLSGWIGKFIKLKLKIGNIFGVIKNFFSRGDEDEEENSLELLETLNNSIEKARADLMDPQVNSFVIVMIPEEMAVAETGRLLNELIKFDIPVSNIVVNQLFPETEKMCDFCQTRRRMQSSHLKRIRNTFGDKMGKNIIQVPLFREEVREYAKLKEMADFLIP